jgi:hypothetical protein
MSETALATVPPEPRRRRRADSSDETLARYRASGLTQRAFCARIGLPLSTLQWWLLRARRHTAAGRPVTFTEIPLPVVSPATAATWAVEIVTATGVTVRLREPLGAAAVRALLRGTRC